MASKAKWIEELNYLADCEADGKEWGVIDSGQVSAYLIREGYARRLTEYKYIKAYQITGKGMGAIGREWTFKAAGKAEAQPATGTAQDVVHLLATRTDTGYPVTRLEPESGSAAAVMTAGDTVKCIKAGNEYEGQYGKVWLCDHPRYLVDFNPGECWYTRDDLWQPDADSGAFEPERKQPFMGTRSNPCCKELDTLRQENAQLLRSEDAYHLENERLRSVIQPFLAFGKAHQKRQSDPEIKWSIFDGKVSTTVCLADFYALVEAIAEPVAPGDGGE